MAESSLEADFLVVGSGVSGYIVAYRLKQSLPQASIVLLREEQFSEGHHSSASQPLFRSAQWSEFYDSFHTVSQSSVNLASEQAAAGTGLSEQSGSISFRAWTRGAAESFDTWAELVGDDRWSYSGIQPFFARSETDHSPRKDVRQHGDDGPVDVVPVSATRRQRRFPLRDIIAEAWRRVGIARAADINDGDPMGVAELKEFWYQGEGPPLSECYDLSDIQVITNVNVSKVIIEEFNGRNIVKGVQLIDGGHITARCEVILAEGPYRTPQLLKLSGIGLAEELSQCGISTIVDNRSVGENLIMPISSTLVWEVSQPHLGVALGSPLLIDPIYYETTPIDFITSNTTPSKVLRSTLSNASYVTSNPYLYKPLTTPHSIHTSTLVAYTALPPSLTAVPVPADGTYISTQSTLLTPTSRGRVLLSSASPTSPPHISPSLLTSPTDIALLRHALRTLLHTFLPRSSSSSSSTPSSSSSSPSFIRRERPPPGFSRLTPDSSSEELDERIEKFGTASGDAAHGTAAMGSVVDSECRVYGVEGLRVVDESVIPVPMTAFGMMAVRCAVAERGAEMVVEAWRG
ncbi:MAG: hypothetical protein Q9227_006879 [Pyrenula ochraceoflavens]